MVNLAQQTVHPLIESCEVELSVCVYIGKSLPSASLQANRIITEALAD